MGFSAWHVTVCLELKKAVDSASLWLSRMGTPFHGKEEEVERPPQNVVVVAVNSLSTQTASLFPPPPPSSSAVASHSAPHSPSSSWIRLEELVSSCMMCAVHKRWTIKAWAECILGKEGLSLSEGTCQCTRNGVALKCESPSHSEGPQWTKVRGLWVGHTVSPFSEVARESEIDRRGSKAETLHINYLHILTEIWRNRNGIQLLFFCTWWKNLRITSSEILRWLELGCFEYDNSCRCSAVSFHVQYLCSKALLWFAYGHVRSFKPCFL